MPQQRRLSTLNSRRTKAANFTEGETMQSKIGFIGLGSMGKPMAANIVKAGFELTVYDLREEPCKALAALGAKIAVSPREVAEKSSIIEIAAVDDEQAEQIGRASCRERV